ncbi:MAG: RnfABCDGE type electron transport complex subunit G [Cyclobacteriaceae bacterium]|nr:RnfABCDGE type electron transport complex subunit G [Cyclobacteriaceae bacterium]
MAKKESTFFNMVFSLSVITLVASAALGYVYEFTKEPIAAAQLAKKVRAISVVVPEYNNNPVEDMYLAAIPGSNDSLEIYPAYQNGELVAAAVRSFSPKGYSGNVWLMVGFIPDGSIFDISVLEHKETPGLGTKMADESFKAQFRNKNPQNFNLKVKKDGGDVDALTGATITSRAFGDAAYTAWKTFMEGGKHD